MRQIEERNQAPVEPAFSCAYNFAFDDFQLAAMQHIRAGRSVMVAAPTSAGKTVVAEYALWRTLQQGTRALYTTPIKALSNQKRRDLETLFPGKVGLLTGDRSENPGAPIIVMTTEVLRNMLLEDPTALHDVTCVVFDEVHYLADPERGTTWEESIIACPPQVQLVCLSATIANAEEIAAWIQQTHREIALIRHDERPVPLEHYYFHRGKLRLVRNAAGERVARFQEDEGQQTPEPATVVRALRRADLLPAIWFAFSRRAVEEAAELCAHASTPLTRIQQEQVESAICWTLATLPPEDQHLPQIARLIALLRRGVGFHHAGLLPPLKELVEELFTRGLLSIVCATDTLAVGINMPARTVVISCLSRPVGGLLTPNEFMQLTGRAGRRGIDERGAAVILPSPYHPFEESYAAVTAKLEPVRSAFQLRYSTMLAAFADQRLDRTDAEERLATFIRSSLRQFQIHSEARRAAEELKEIDAALAALPALPELVGREQEFAAYLELQGRLTIAQRELKRARNARRKNRKSAGARQRQEEASTESQHLYALLRLHPMHELAKDPTFQLAASEHIRLLRQRNRVLRTIEEARLEGERDATETARAVRAVLTCLGYIDRHGLRPKAHGLRELVAPSGIVISELYHRGELEDLEPAELAEVLSWFACDVDRRRYNTYRLPEKLQRLQHVAQRCARHIRDLEQSEGIDLTPELSTWFHGVALAWCRGDSIERITKRIELGEGDIVSLLNKTVDLLEQFEGFLLRNDDTRMLAISTETRRLLCRGLVALMRTDGAILEDEAALLA
jgi:superfamily II RNA helicase